MVDISYYCSILRQFQPFSFVIIPNGKKWLQIVSKTGLKC
nr:MAG TPA: hypothetical protein [Bacteriophage sp.]